jgi:Fe/S biogenesis protein NfuA
MVNITLKEGIEANLKQAFPGMIKEVVDNTNHEQTEETYKPA